MEKEKSIAEMTYMGRPISELSKEELIKSLVQMHEYYESRLANKDKQIELANLRYKH
jgi:hypothetical protein